MTLLWLWFRLHSQAQLRYYLNCNNRIWETLLTHTTPHNTTNNKYIYYWVLVTMIGRHRITLQTVHLIPHRLPTINLKPTTRFVFKLCSILWFVRFYDLGLDKSFKTNPTFLSVVCCVLSLAQYLTKTRFLKEQIAYPELSVNLWTLPGKLMQLICKLFC